MPHAVRTERRPIRRRLEGPDTLLRDREQLHEEGVHKGLHTGGRALIWVVELCIKLVQHCVEGTAHERGLPLEPLEKVVIRVCPTLVGGQIYVWGPRFS